MKTWVWSYSVWSVWIGFFLVIELTGLKHLVPWVTLSQTSWHAEHTYAILRTLLFAFLLGLLVHIIFERHLLACLAFGVVVAVAAHVLVKLT